MWRPPFSRSRWSCPTGEHQGVSHGSWLACWTPLLEEGAPGSPVEGSRADADRSEVVTSAYSERFFTSSEAKVGTRNSWSSGAICRKSSAAAMRSQAQEAEIVARPKRWCGCAVSADSWVPCDDRFALKALHRSQSNEVYDDLCSCAPEKHGPMKSKTSAPRSGSPLEKC